MPCSLASASHDTNGIVNGTKDDQNEEQHDFLDHMTPLAPALASHDAGSFVNGIITFFLCSDN